VGNGALPAEKSILGIKNLFFYGFWLLINRKRVGKKNSEGMNDRYCVAKTVSGMDAASEPTGKYLRRVWITQYLL